MLAKPNEVFFYFFLFLLKCVCRVMSTKKGYTNSWITELNTFMVCWFLTIFFLKLLFPWIWWFFPQDTYNSWLKERYEDNLSTHSNLDPNLWLEAWSSSGSNINWVYNLSNTTTKNLQTTRSALTIGYLQLILSTQTPELAVM